MGAEITVSVETLTMVLSGAGGVIMTVLFYIVRRNDADHRELHTRISALREQMGTKLHEVWMYLIDNKP